MPFVFWDPTSRKLEKKNNKNDWLNSLKYLNLLKLISKITFDIVEFIDYITLY